MTLWVVCFTFGCATVNPLTTHYENNFDDFRPSLLEQIKSSPLKKEFHHSYNEVWDSALHVLTQHAIITDASKSSGIITFISIDGIYFGDEFKKDIFYYWEFPFTALIEEADAGCVVFIYPMTDLYLEHDKKKSWWKTINAGFNQKGEEFIERLATQLSAHERWLWLRD